MREILINAINEIRFNCNLVLMDEASTKAAVILRLLSELKWNPFNIEEVKPEYNVGGKWVDYSLRIANINKLFIEVKRIKENLEPHQEQLLQYSFQEGVKLAILTNGATWWFYLPLSEGSWEQRRFLAIDIFEQEPGDVADRFISFLYKKNIASGEALKNAEYLYRSHQKKSALRDAIPRAWTKIIKEPDDLLVDLLIETTEKMSGFRPEMNDIEQFLKKNLNRFITSKTTVLAKNLSTTEIDSRTFPSSPIHSTNSTVDYINKKPISFIFCGKKYHPKSWQEILLVISNEIYKKHKDEFERCLVLRGPKMAYFSTNKNELSYPKTIASSKYHVESKLNSNSIVRRSRDLMDLFGYNEDDLIIEAK